MESEPSRGPLPALSTLEALVGQEAALPQSDPTRGAGNCTRRLHFLEDAWVCTDRQAPPPGEASGERKVTHDACGHPSMPIRAQAQSCPVLGAHASLGPRATSVNAKGTVPSHPHFCNQPNILSSPLTCPSPLPGNPEHPPVTNPFWRPCSVPSCPGNTEPLRAFVQPALTTLGCFPSRRAHLCHHCPPLTCPAGRSHPCAQLLNTRPVSHQLQACLGLPTRDPEQPTGSLAAGAHRA